MDYILEIVLGVLGGMTLVQLTPIKIDPWTWLARKVGHAINGELIERMDKLEATVKEVQTTGDERDAKATRIRILRFGDEILHGVHHSKEHFDQTLLDITEYERYCRDHPDFVNNMTELTSKHIMETYSACFEDKKF
jgi:hypothetical protein